MSESGMKYGCSKCAEVVRFAELARLGGLLAEPGRDSR